MMMRAMKKIHIHLIILALVLIVLVVLILVSSNESEKGALPKNSVEITVPSIIFEYIEYYPSDIILHAYDVVGTENENSELSSVEDENEEILAEEVLVDETMPIEEDIASSESGVDPETGKGGKDFQEVEAVEDNSITGLTYGRDLSGFIAESNVSNAIWNEDHSLTIRMTEKRFDEWKIQNEEGLLKALKIIEENQEADCIDRIELSEDYREISIYVDKMLYEDEILDYGIFSIAFSVLLYQSYIGEELSTEVLIFDKTTNQVIEKYIYPKELIQVTDSETQGLEGIPSEEGDTIEEEVFADGKSITEDTGDEGEEVLPQIPNDTPPVIRPSDVPEGEEYNGEGMGRGPR